MNYVDFVRDRLRLTADADCPLAFDLFAGCGGLALGLEAAGFRTLGFERNIDAAETYRNNLHGDCRVVELVPGMDLGPTPDVIVGGPPCQPFSVNGNQAGKSDERDGFPTFLDAIDRYRPAVAMFENVRGMLYQNRTYFDRIRLSLCRLGYQVEWRLLNAAEYGVPQRRERLVVVAHRGGWSFPRPSAHRFTAGEALGGFLHDIPSNAKFLTPSMDAYVARYEAKSHCVRPRDIHPEEACRTVTCRNLNGATGDMLRIRLPDGRRRRLTVREGARLQGFPDWFVFSGSEGSQFNQIGNAVPPVLARAIGDAVMRCLAGGSKPELAEIAAQGELFS